MDEKTELKRPPLGVMPRWLFEEEYEGLVIPEDVLIARKKALDEAIERYSDYGNELTKRALRNPCSHWILESMDIIDKLKKANS